MKCVVSIKHCDSICWNKFVNHVKSLIIIKSQMGYFQGNYHEYVIDSIFDKQLFSNGR